MIYADALKKRRGKNIDPSLLAQEEEAQKDSEDAEKGMPEAVKESMHKSPHIEEAKVRDDNVEHSYDQEEYAKSHDEMGEHVMDGDEEEYHRLIKQGHEPRSLGERAKMEAMHKKYGDPKPKLGTGERFHKLEGELEEKGAKDPGALAAYIGREKYGNKKMSALAHHKKG